MDRKRTTKWLTCTAMLMAMNIALSSFGVPVPGGHLYLNDIVICSAAILLDPFAAFCVGGVGAFLGDLLFYPAPMFVSLVTHGVQAVVISLFCHRLLTGKREFLGALLGTLLGALIMVAGYTFGRAYIYSTPEYAIMKLPFQFLQAGVGVAVSLVVLYGLGLKKTLVRRGALPENMAEKSEKQ